VPDLPVAVFKVLAGLPWQLCWQLKAQIVGGTETYQVVCYGSENPRPPCKVVVQANMHQVEFPGAKVFLGDKHGNAASLRKVPPLVLPVHADGGGGGGAREQQEAGGQEQGSGKRRAAGSEGAAELAIGPSKKRLKVTPGASAAGEEGADGSDESDDSSNGIERRLGPITCRVILRKEQGQQGTDNAGGVMAAAAAADFEWHSAPFRGPLLTVPQKRLGDIVDETGTYSIVVSAELRPGDTREAVLCRYQIAYASQEELYKKLEAVHEQLTKLNLEVESKRDLKVQKERQTHRLQQTLVARQQGLAVVQQKLQSLNHHLGNVARLENAPMHNVVSRLYGLTPGTKSPDWIHWPATPAFSLGHVVAWCRPAGYHHCTGDIDSSR
jgi:hypothetical protein